MKSPLRRNGGSFLLLVVIMALAPMSVRAIGPGQDFTLVALPDTQYYVANLYGGIPDIFTNQTQWVVNNRTNRNIAYVTQLGDCVEHGDNFGNDVEWRHATNALYRLENPVTTQYPAYGIPYGVAVGNHDNSTDASGDDTTVFYNQYFGEAHFSPYDYYGGHFGTNSDNHFSFFSASGMDFIVLYFEYDETATNTNAPVYVWANAVLATNANRRAIAVSHWIVNDDGSFGPQGQTIYNALKANTNLFLMLCGHVADYGESRRVDVYNGNTVWSALSDYQYRPPQAGNGYLRLYEFSPSNNVIRVKTYSPWLDQYETDADSQFEIQYKMFGGAATLTWDADGVSGGSTGGTGLWNISDKLWDNTGTMVNWNNASPDSAIFGGTPGLVTVQTSAGVPGDYIGADSITFNTAGYVIGGSGNLTANTLAGTGDFTKIGSGVLKLLGNSPYAGALTLGGGLLELADGATLTSSAGIAIQGGAGTSGGSSYPFLGVMRGGTFSFRESNAHGTQPLTLNNGGILWYPSSSSASTNTMPNVSLTGGFNTLAVAPNSTNATLLIGSLTRSNSAAVEFRTAWDVLGTGQARIQAGNLNSAPIANVNGILGGWAFVAQSSGVNNTFPARNFASWNGSTVVAATPDKASGASGGTVNSTDIATGVSTENWLANSTSGNRTIAANVTINSLIEQQDLWINSGATLTLAAGGLILRSNSFWMQSSTGTGYLTSGNNDLYLQADGGGGDQQIRVVIKDGNAGAVALRKSGSGLVKLNQNNTYTGGTFVNQGTLDLQTGGGTACIRGSASINPGGILYLTSVNAFGYTSASVSVTNVNINGGTLNNGSGGDNGYYTTFNLTGGTMTGGGYWIFGSAANSAVNSLASPVVSTIGGNIYLKGDVANLPITTAAGTTPGGIDLTISAPIAGDSGKGIVKSGPGYLRLSAANIYTGVTTVSNGTLEVAGNFGLHNSSSFAVAGGGTFKLNAINIFTTGHDAPIGNSRVITVDAATLLMDTNFSARFGNVTLQNGATWTCNRPVSGLGSSGYDALLANTSAGTATVLVTNTSGTAASTMSGSGGIRLQGVQNFDVADVTGNADTDLMVSLVLTGPDLSGGAAGGLNKLGGGTMTLSAVNTYSGATTVNAGQLRVNGSLGATPTTVNSGGTLAGSGVIAGPVTVNAGGTLSPGSSIGTLTVSNNLNLAGTTLAEVSLTAGVASDLVLVNGDVNYGGTLVVTNVGASALTNGMVFHLFTVSGSKSNNFNSVTVLPDTGLTGTFDPATGNVTLSASVTPPPTLQLSNVSSGVYQLSWTGSFLLQYQTNSLTVGLSTNWSNYPDLSNPVNVTNHMESPATFYRLISTP